MRVGVRVHLRTERVEMKADLCLFWSVEQVRRTNLVELICFGKKKRLYFGKGPKVVTPTCRVFAITILRSVLKQN